MQHEGDVVWFGIAAVRRRGRLAVVDRDQFEYSGGVAAGAHDLDHGNLQLGRDTECGRGTAALDDQGLGLEVGEIEFELVGAVGRIERCRGRAGRDRHERGGHLGSVRQHQRHTVIAPDPEPVKTRHGALDVFTQAAVSQRRAAAADKGNGIGGLVRQQLMDRGKNGHGCSPFQKNYCGQCRPECAVMLSVFHGV